MLSFLPQRDETATPCVGADLQIGQARDVYEIIVIDHADDQALVPMRNVHPLPAVQRRGRRRIMMPTAAAAVVCAAVGFGAGMLLGKLPAPNAPGPPPALSSVPAWLASSAPVRVETLSIAGGGAVPQLAGWVAGSDIGGRGVKVQLLGTEGPLTTLAIELHAEPRMAMLRGVSSRAFDIEIGPITGAVRAQELAPPDGIAFIRRVTVQKQSGSRDGLVRVRVNLDAPGQGNLRVVGRTIYADFAARSAAS
jgi:hypothetical protein